MSREKQIEETANEMYRTLMLEAECELSGMDCAVITSLLVNRKGYRKASDVAREIFEEIEEVRQLHTIGNIGGLTLNARLRELKNKYTEGEK